MTQFADHEQDPAAAPATDSEEQLQKPTCNEEKAMGFLAV